MVSCFADIKYCVKICRLSGRGKNSRYSAFQICYFRSNQIIGRILAPCIKISVVLQIKQTPHFFRGIIFKGSTLIDGHHSGLAFFGLPTGLDTFGFNMVFLAHFFPLHSVYILKNILPLFPLQGYLKFIYLLKYFCPTSITDTKRTIPMLRIIKAVSSLTGCTVSRIPKIRRSTPRTAIPAPVHIINFLSFFGETPLANLSLIMDVFPFHPKKNPARIMINARRISVSYLAIIFPFFCLFLCIVLSYQTLLFL